MKKNDIISGVHNYCDRWCERCVFLERCAVGLEELQRWNRDAPASNEEMWESMNEHLKESLRLLDEMIDEADFDLTEDELELKIESNRDLEKLEDDFFERGLHYFKLTNAFFAANEAFLTAKEKEIARLTEMNLPIDLDRLGFIQDAIDIIQQYAAFIGIKARRAISGLDEVRQPDFGDADPHQSDANGSAKACILCLEQSLAAWDTLRQYWPEKTDEMLDIFVTLTRFRQEMQRLFPDWQQFIRPGFDTEPMQVRRFEMN